jgi:ankyrin repeat protein
MERVRNRSLFDAIRNDNVKSAKYFLKKEIDINEIRNGLTALTLAVSLNLPEMVKLLLDKGADVNLPNENRDTPLILAVSAGNLEIARILLNNDADINLVNRYGDTTLEIAITLNSMEMIELLLNKGANGVPIANANALIFHASITSLPILKLLIKKGVNINVLNDRAQTPLMFAVRESNTTGSLEIVQFLLSNGADINAVDINGWSALMVAINYSDTKSSLETVKLLLAYGADVFTVNQYTNTIEKCPTEECRNLVAEHIWKTLYARDKNMAARYARNGQNEVGERSVVNEHSEVNEHTELSEQNDIIPSIGSPQRNLPKDVWEIILLNKRQQLLCTKLKTQKNREVLKFFALELNIPITDEMTKGQLCGVIARQLVYGKIYNKTDKEREVLRKQFLEVAKKYNIDTNQPIEKIIADISRVFY